MDNIHISAETLGNLTMDELYAIAKKYPEKGVKPMDRVILFLQQEQKLLRQEEEAKRQAAIREIVAEQNAERARKEAEDQKRLDEIAKK